MEKIKYPIRCKIIDIGPFGHKVGRLTAKTPAESKPHIGKEGTAYREKPGVIRIELDDGNIIYGHSCWWVPIE